MGIKTFEVWLDSGANIHSCRRVTTSTEDMGLTPEEWEAMSEETRLAIIKDIAFEQADWGYSEIIKG